MSSRKIDVRPRRTDVKDHRGVFHCHVDLQAALNRLTTELNADLKPFVWTKPANVILENLQRCPAPSV